MVNRVEGATRVTRLFLLAKRLSPTKTSHVPTTTLRLRSATLFFWFDSKVLWSFFSFSIPSNCWRPSFKYEAFLVLLLRCRGFLLRGKMTPLFASGWRATLRVEIIFIVFEGWPFSSPSLSSFTPPFTEVFFVLILEAENTREGWKWELGWRLFSSDLLRFHLSIGAFNASNWAIDQVPSCFILNTISFNSQPIGLSEFEKKKKEEERFHRSKNFLFEYVSMFSLVSYHTVAGKRIEEFPSPEATVKL